MTRPSDETLLQYVDGKLSEVERASVEAALKEDPQLRAFADAMRESEQLAKTIFDRPMHEPAPQRLVDAVLNAPSASSSSVVSFASLKRFIPSGGPFLRMAAAASMALLVGAVAGYMVRDLGNRAAPVDILALGEVESRGSLGRLLETAQSGAVAAADSGATQQRHTIVATFLDKQKRPCREVEVLAPPTEGDHPLIVAMACRTKGGAWVIEGAVRLASQKAPSSAGYEPSGLADKDAVDGLLTMLGAGQSLSSEEERSLIARRWRASE